MPPLARCTAYVCVPPGYAQIDFVCHDAEPYVGAGDSATKADIYDFVKAQGRFLGTRRTGVRCWLAVSAAAVPALVP